jgi:hypothetical protein
MTKDHFTQMIGALLAQDPASKRWQIECKKDDYHNQYAGTLKIRLTTGDWIEGDSVGDLNDDSFVLEASTFERGPMGGKNLTTQRRYAVRYDLVAFACLEQTQISAKSTFSR